LSVVQADENTSAPKASRGRVVKMGPKVQVAGSINDIYFERRKATSTDVSGKRHLLAHLSPGRRADAIGG